MRPIDANALGIGKEKQEMMMDKLKVIEALEHCTKRQCKPCQFHSALNCTETVMKKALFLIRKLMLENENLKEQNELQKEKMLSVQRYTARGMQMQIRTKCRDAGIYPVFVAAVVDQVAEELAHPETKEVSEGDQKND